MLETGEKSKFIIGQNVQVKRTNGSWSDAIVIGVFQDGVRVRFIVGDTFRGDPYYGEQRNAYKFIVKEQFDSYLKV